MKGFLPAMLGLLMAFGSPMAAVAETTCPPKDLAEALPGASDVAFFENGVTSARFPGQWQEGKVSEGKLSYRLFVDGSGTVSNDLRLRGWRVDFTCDPQTRQCSYASTSFPPDHAVKAAKTIGDCLIAAPPAPKKPAEIPVAAAEKPEEKPAVTAAPAKEKVKPATAAGVTSKPAVAAKAPSPPAPAKGITLRVTGQNPSIPGVSANKTVPAAPPAAFPTDPAPLKALTQPYVGFALPPLASRAAGPAIVPVHGGAGGFQASTPAEAPKAALDATGPAITALPDRRAPSVCWADYLPGEPAGARIQRLLLLAGYDPGPVDGTSGGRTKAALQAALGGGSADTDEGILRQLRARLCDPGDRR